MSNTNDRDREAASALVEHLFRLFEKACEADGLDTGCIHTPDGDPLICWHCRQRYFELVARRPIAQALATSREEGREAILRHITGAVMLSESPVGPLHKIGWNAAVQHIVSKANSDAPGVNAVEAAYSRGKEEGRREGAESERRACWLLADEPECAFVRDAIAARGPMTPVAD